MAWYDDRPVGLSELTPLDRIDAIAGWYRDRTGAVACIEATNSFDELRDFNRERIDAEVLSLAREISVKKPSL